MWKLFVQVASASGATPLGLTADFAFKSSSKSLRLRRAFARYEGIIRDQKTLWSRSTTPETLLPLSRYVCVCVRAFRFLAPSSSPKFQWNPD